MTQDEAKSLTGANLIQLFWEACLKSGFNPWPANPAARRAADKLAASPDASQLPVAIQNYARHLESTPIDARRYLIRPANWFGRNSRWREHLTSIGITPASGGIKQEPELESHVLARSQHEARRAKLAERNTAIQKRVADMMGRNPALTYSRAYRLARLEWG